MRGRLTLRVVAAALAVLASQAPTLAAFARAGRADGMVAAAGCALLWLGVLALSAPAAGACLALSLALGVLAVLAGGPGWLAVAAAGASVAAWELTRLAAGRPRDAEPRAERRLLGSHLRALAAGILPGLALAGIAGQVRLTLPFPVMLGLAILALLALDRAARRWG